MWSRHSVDEAVPLVLEGLEDYDLQQTELICAYVAFDYKLFLKIGVKEL